MVEPAYIHSTYAILSFPGYFISIEKLKNPSHPFGRLPLILSPSGLFIVPFPPQKTGVINTI